MPGEYPLPSSDPASLGFAAKPLDHLDRLIKQHIEDGRYPGAQIALARRGQLALFRTYGDAKTEPTKLPATNDNLFLLFSQTKVLTSSAVWTLVEEGRLSFMDRIADHLPEFAARGKADITLHQVMTHQGGFPSSNVTRASWTDHARMRAEVCDFSLDWTPGSKLQYHGQAAHLVQAMVIEAVTGQDYRDVIRDNVLAPLGLANDVFVGVPLDQQVRCADTYAPEGRDNTSEFRSAGLPSGGGYATARGMAAFYQMLLGQGRLGNVRLLVAAAGRLRVAQSHRRTGRRADERYSDASRTWPARARRERPHPWARHDWRAGDVRPWRRRFVVFLGRPRERRVVQLSYQLRIAGSLAFRSAGSRGEPGPRGDRLNRHRADGPCRTLPAMSCPLRSATICRRMLRTYSARRSTMPGSSMVATNRPHFASPGPL